MSIIVTKWYVQHVSIKVHKCIDTTNVVPHTQYHLKFDRPKIERRHVSKRLL